jgi:two-component system, NarL family, nitrate/nitrite response regulator NarL
MPVRVLLAEDHPVYLEGLSAAIGGAPDLELALVCEDGARALEGIRDAQPDVAVLDLRLPILTAREVLQNLATDDETTTRVLILSAHLDGDAIVDCVELGATGYMAKDATRKDILEAIRTVASGQAVISAEAQTSMAEAMRRRALAGEPLSAREREILELLAEGASAPEIARRLYLSPATVKTHLHNVYEKLGVSERAAAVAEGMRRGLIT